jgi:hypothetical protein
MRQKRLKQMLFAGPFGFFLFTMVTIVVLNSANGIYQNSIWGLVADFPGRFTNAIVVGNNLCGILMALLYILIVLCTELLIPEPLNTKKPFKSTPASD